MAAHELDTNRQYTDKELSTNRRIQQLGWAMIVVLAVLLIGLGSGYVRLGGTNISSLDVAALQQQVNPVDGYALPVTYGDLGPRMLQGGVFDYESFAAIYENSGNPLSPEQIEILKHGGDAEIVITADNAHFLLNFFWAVGLANNNSILTEGPIMQRSEGQVERFASTGGWTIAAKPVTEIYASLNLIGLTSEQQNLVEEVAAAIYRPCCDNHTLFPDCNHGMAMLGILELMASQGATADEMFEAAKYINAYWFPQQTLETAIYLQMTEHTDFTSADARRVVSAEFSSGSGSARVHQALQSKGLLEQSPNQGGSCTN